MLSEVDLGFFSIIKKKDQHVLMYFTNFSY